MDYSLKSLIGIPIMMNYDTNNDNSIQCVGIIHDITDGLIVFQPIEVVNVVISNDPHTSVVTVCDSYSTVSAYSVYRIISIHKVTYDYLVNPGETVILTDVYRYSTSHTNNHPVK
jgi:hypothetical protein